MPIRIQRRRTKGWRMGDAVYVGRPTKYGNPFKVGDTGIDNAGLAKYAYRLNVMRGSLPFTDKQTKEELRGKDLCCWCPLDQECHADILLELANRVTSYKGE